MTPGASGFVNSGLATMILAEKRAGYIHRLYRGMLMILGESSNIHSMRAIERGSCKAAKRPRCHYSHYHNSRNDLSTVFHRSLRESNATARRCLIRRTEREYPVARPHHLRVIQPRVARVLHSRGLQASPFHQPTPAAPRRLRLAVRNKHTFHRASDLLLRRQYATSKYSPRDRQWPPIHSPKLCSGQPSSRERDEH